MGKNKDLIGLFKDELGGRIMKEFCALRTKTYSYLMDDNSEVTKSQGTQKCVIKRKTMLENYADCLFNNKIILKLQQRLKNNHHKVYTEDVNRIALSGDDDKRLQTFNRVTIYPYESEMMMVRDLFVKKCVDCPFHGELVLKQ